MQAFPHRYRVEALATQEGPVAIGSTGLDPLATAPPSEFGGPGDRWSPETLLVASVVDCFALTFRAVARASSLGWIGLRCEGEGELDRVERTMRFTRIALRAFLDIPAATDTDQARRLLEKAERTCLITNSLACPVELEVHVAIAAAPPEAGA